MFTQSSEIVAANYFLEPGYIYVPSDPTVISTVLGSSVAVGIYDKKHQFGGMAHFQLPHMSEPDKTTPRYGNVATLTLLRMMRQQGAKAKHLQAQLFGGAHRNEMSERKMGHENVRASQRVLAQMNIRIVSEDTGGEKGRKVVFNTHTFEIAVLKVDKLRNSDWFPYPQDR